MVRPRKSAQSTVRYLAYGSNLHPVRLRARTASAQLLGTAVLEAWQLVFHKRGQDGSGKCNIRPGQGQVFAAVYAIESGELRQLDAIEGVNRGYYRQPVDVPDYGQCFVYRAQQTHVDARIRPFCWYQSLVLQGCLYHDFPGQYVARIRAERYCADPNEQRRASNERLLRKIADCNRLHLGEK